MEGMTSYREVWGRGKGGAHAPGGHDITGVVMVDLDTNQCDGAGEGVSACVTHEMSALPSSELTRCRLWLQCCSQGLGRGRHSKRVGPVRQWRRARPPQPAMSQLN